MDGSTTLRMLMDGARRLTVDSVLVRDAAELMHALDRNRQDPDSRRVIGQLKEMATRYRDLAVWLRLLAVELQQPGTQPPVSRIDEALLRYLDERTATRRAQGGSA